VGSAIGKQISKIYSQATFKLISYTLTDDGEITLYTHAPYNINCMKSLWDSLEIPGKFIDKTPAELANSIDKINKNFVEKVKSGEFFELLEKERTAYSATKSDPFYFPLNAIIWGRVYLEFPGKHNGYSVNYVHGHDSGRINSSNYFCIDNIYGKFNDEACCTVSSKNIGFFIEKSLPAEKLEEIKILNEKLISIYKEIDNFIEKFEKDPARIAELNNLLHLLKQTSKNSWKELINSKFNLTNIHKQFTEILEYAAINQNKYTKKTWFFSEKEPLTKTGKLLEEMANNFRI